MLESPQYRCLWRCGPRDCHTEQNKSEENKYHILTQIWNLEKQYRWSHLQNRNKDTDVENKHIDTKQGKRWGGMNSEVWMDTYTTTDEDRQLCSLLCGDLKGKEIQKRKEMAVGGGGGGVCVCLCLILFAVWQKLAQHYKATILQ